MMKHIGIIGCGWFGLPLAKFLLQQGYRVSGTKRTQAGLTQLVEARITPCLLDLDNPVASEPLQQLLAADVLVINIPPGLRRGETQYLTQLNQLLMLMGDRLFDRVIFISTTGVYPVSEAEQLSTPLSEDKARSHCDVSDILLQAEALFSQAEPLLHKSPSTIVRFAGLVGPNRHPGRFFAGKTEVSGANVAVNLVHLDDCIHGVCTIIKAHSPGPIYNLVAPLHPRRGDFYLAATLHLGLVVPTFNDVKMPSKVIDGELICTELGFVYQHEDPMEMRYSC
jgi:nucleoside-diphosphate-sugar epimerase